jgi:hypothetical protein
MPSLSTAVKKHLRKTSDSVLGLEGYGLQHISAESCPQGLLAHRRGGLMRTLPPASLVAAENL